MKVTKIIKLTQKQVALIDLEDAPLVGKYKWHANWNQTNKSFYASANTPMVNGKRGIHIRMSRLIVGLKNGDRRQVDHKNHNTLDNRKENLRIVTNSQNQQNRLNIKGCHWHKRAQKYMARIKVNNKRIHLGYYHIESEAHQAYLDARKKYGFIE